MAVQTLKILGQVAPSATTETDLYTCPASTQTTVSSIVICNRGTSDATFRIVLSANGASTANKDYLYYDTPVSANDTFVAMIGLTCDAADKIKVYASNGSLSFSAFGVEVA